MFRLVMRGTQEDRFKQDSDTKSCLTLVLSGSDNHSIRFCGHRKSFCGLQLDGFFGAMLWSHGAIVARVDGLWPVDESPRVADQTGLPIISGLCGQPCFGFRSIGRVVATLRNRFVAEIFRQSFLRTLTGTAVRTVEALPRFVPARNSVLRGYRIETQASFSCLLVRSPEIAVEETSSCC